MPLEVFTAFIFRHEIGIAVDAAICIYHENTAKADIREAGITLAMRKGAKDKTTKMYSKLAKMVTIANPSLTLEWLAEIGRHWSLNVDPELTLDKLQLLANSNAESIYKVRWLKWWNSSPPTREARRFPPRPMKTDCYLSCTKLCGMQGLRRVLENHLSSL